LGKYLTLNPTVIYSHSFDDIDNEKWIYDWPSYFDGRVSLIVHLGKHLDLTLMGGYAKLDDPDAEEERFCGVSLEFNYSSLLNSKK